MKLLSLALFILAIAPLSASQYIGIELGTNHLELTNQSSGLKVGYIAGAKFGYIFDSGIRLEATGHYRRNVRSTKYTFGDTDVVVSKNYQQYHSWSYMVNCLYDLNKIAVNAIVPYVGVGGGYAQNTQHDKQKFDTTKKSDKLKDGRFAYQGIVGAKYYLNADYSSALEYKYFCGQSHAKDHTVSLSLNRHF